MSRFRIFSISIFIFMFFHYPVIVDIDNVYGQDQTINRSSRVTVTIHDSQIASESSKTDKGTTVGVAEQNKRDKSATTTNPSTESNLNSKDIVNSKEEEQEKERDIMEEALQLLNESSAYWEKGDLEKALDMLDQAYALILDTDGDPDISRQKDDVRLLISKKILTIYTSMHTATQGKRSAIPYTLNADVEKEIHKFQTVERDFFIQSYKRSGPYLPIIQRELKKAGLPEELSWLPLVESGFKIHALSSARALGLWQFIPSTGYKYGLNRDEWVDERLDVEKSTRAAIDYFKDLHGMFGDWLTVLAAYNCGEGRVLKVISRQHINYFDRFWDLYQQLPHETARYVPRFLATLLIIKDPKKYDMDLEKDMDQPYLYETVITSKSMRLQDIASHTGTSEDILNALNSELRQRITPDKEYNLKVPLKTAEKLTKVVDEIPECEKPRQSFIKHKAKRGETVVSIARRYGTSVGTIMSYNNLSSRKRLKPGQTLIIPSGGGRSYAKLKSNNQSKGNRSQNNEVIIKYKIKKGDTLESLAKHFNTSADEIAKMNRLKKNKLTSGQIVKISKTTEGEDRSGKRKSKVTSKALSKKTKKISTDQSTTEEEKYIVKKGDSLDRIARKKGVTLDKLREKNNLADKDSLRPGQVIIVN
jgi:membrane-bound lytic murein transglycosylase D